ncbi:uncharacterized protein TNCV_2976261, partial [Trichonephila clavipes]
ETASSKILMRAQKRPLFGVVVRREECQLRCHPNHLSRKKTLCCFESTSLSLKACIPPTRKNLLSAAISIGEKIMNDAAKGIRQLKKSIHGIVNCGVSVDGTWQRRSFSSLNGCVSAISVDTGKIIDFETLSQFCRKCNSKTKQQNVKLQCNHHIGSSSSMEPVGAYRIFERSEDHRMLRAIH